MERRTPLPESVPAHPVVSVVLPVRNEASTIDETMAGVLGQDYPGPLEVVVADGLSDDGTRRYLETLSTRDPRVRVIDNPDGTTPAGLNAAIRASVGDVIVRCDGHAVLPRGYVRRAVELLADTGADNVGGMQAAEGRGVFQRAIAHGMSTPLGVGNARFHFGGPPGPADTVYLGVFRRDVFDRVGMFDEDLPRTQDSDLNYRIRAAGGTVYFHPDLRVTYRPRRRLRDLWEQYWRSGSWKREAIRRRPGSLEYRQLAPPLLVGVLAMCALLALTPAWPLALIAPSLYVLALAAGGMLLAVRRRDPAALLLPLVVPTMHVAWGLGFLSERARPSLDRSSPIPS